jgi:hypothetical protein
MNKPPFHVKKLRVYQPPDPTDEQFAKEKGPYTEFKVGDLVDLNRTCHSNSPFGLAIILGFTDPLHRPLSGRAGDTGFLVDGFLVDENDRLVRLARPYAYAILTGTSNPSALTGVEVFEIRADQLLDVVRTGDGFVGFLGASHADGTSRNNEQK